MEVSGDVGGGNVVYVELEYLDTASLRIVICYLISIQQIHAWRPRLVSFSTGNQTSLLAVLRMWVTPRSRR